MGNPAVHYLSLDVEGTSLLNGPRAGLLYRRRANAFSGVEFDILKTVPWGLVDIRVITIEVEHMTMTERLDLVEYLDDKGFDFITNLGDLDYLFAKRI